MVCIQQGINTRYLRATDRRGASIKATAWAGSVIISYDHALNYEDAHKAAADALIAKMGWVGKFAQGGNVKGDGYYFVNIEGA